MPDETLKAIQQSIQNLPTATSTNGTSSVGFWVPATERGPLLPPWGTRERERRLRSYDRDELNNLWQGASLALINKFANTPSQLKGGRNLTAYFDDVLRFSQFQQGQRHLKKLIARDYLRFDGGAYLEIIAPGNPLKAPTGRVAGLAHLDSFNCLPTGDPEFPVVYYNTRPGKKPALNLLHHTRVIHFVDLPDGDAHNPGYGLCALSRAIALVWREILMGRYIMGSLDDKPQPGIVLAQGMNEASWQRAWGNFRQQQSTDLMPEWGKNLPIFSLDPAMPVKLENFTFSTPPDKFDFKVYVELDVHELALALGVGIQDIWELTSGNIGSAGQSEIQHVKSRGNTLGDMLGMWELGINNYVLPESLEYEHKVRDPYEASERASNAQVWAAFLQSAGDSLTKEEKRQILANQVEAVADAIIDGSGELVRLDDIDPVAEDQQERVIEDSTPNAPADSAPNATPMQLEAKDFAETAATFATDFQDLVRAGLADEVSRRRAGVVLRAQLSRLGRAAYEEGLKAGGVEDGMSADDRSAAALLIAEQSDYVTDFLNGLYANGLTDAAVETHGQMWINKSLTPFYQAGLASADANGVYEWVLGDAEHCASCLKMAGQKHRLKEYMDTGVLPQSSELECKGYLCKCGLQKTSGRTKGDWLG